jgi:endo-1,4-beta-xylanase
VGVPLWATELDVMSTDENKRADFYEKALRTLYAHPAVEGILFWGFWDQSHWRGDKAALVKGDNLDVRQYNVM